MECGVPKAGVKVNASEDNGYGSRITRLDGVTGGLPEFMFVPCTCLPSGL
jgi:hypothetical protein